jgi:hypothetical protein
VQASFLTIALPRGVLVLAVLKRASVIHLFLKMARKIEEAANFAFVQLINQEPGIYHKCHADCAKQDKIDLVWERISHETKESGSWLSSFQKYKHLNLNCHRRKDAPNVFFS